MCRIFFHFFVFYNLKCLEKCGSRHPAKEVALGQMSKIFKVYIRIIFFKKPKKKLQYSQKVILRCYYIYFWFFIVWLPKKMKTEKWPKAADSPLPVICDSARLNLLRIIIIIPAVLTWTNIMKQKINILFKIPSVKSIKK